MKKFLSFCMLISVVAACPTAQAQVESASCQELDDVLYSDTLRVATLNIAHGRGLGMNQMLLKGPTIRENLARVASVVREIDADLVGLQEVDGPSRWSGSFNHVDYLAGEADYPCYAHGMHAVQWLYAFGTALLSRTRFVSVMAHDFSPSPPTTSKGFTMGDIYWNPGGALERPKRLHIISVHLDFSRKSVRESQIAELSEHMDSLTQPIILLGDFNLEWAENGSPLRELAKKAGLVTWQPQSNDLATYDDGKKRLDWIFASKDLEYRSQRVAQEQISDHRAVIAEFSLKH